MFKRNQALIPGILLLFIIPSFVRSQEQKADKPAKEVTLKECITNALANNLDLSIEAFNPAIDEASISRSKEKYIPDFSLTYYKQDQNQPGTWGVEGTSVMNKYDSYTLSLNERVVTGGTISLSFSNSSTDTSRAFTIINPSYSSSFRLNVTQPLLKGFGPKVNRIETLQAINQRDISLSSLKSRLIQTIYDVEAAYWNLYSAIENLKVQENSLEQSRAILKKNQEAVRIGTKSALDILTSEAEVARYEDFLVSARLTVEQNEASLRKILNLPDDSPVSAQSLIPKDKPVIEKMNISYEEALRIALEQRPEIAQTEIELENNANNISLYRNELLPQLDLTFSTWSPGQSGIKNIYDTGNAFTGTVIGQIKGSRIEALKEALKRTYKNWSANLSLSIPLANIFARNSLAKAKIEQEQALIRLEKQKQSIAYEVAGAIKEFQNAERKIASSKASRELQEKRLEAEMQKYQLGLGSVEWLLNYQRDLTTAKTSEIQALIGHKLAVARLERVMGTTLRSKGLKFRDYEF